MMTLSDVKINCSKRVEREGMLIVNTASFQRYSRKSATGWGEVIFKFPKTQSFGVGCVKRLKALGSAKSKDSNLEVWLWLLQGLAS